MAILQHIVDCLRLVREKRPLIHHLTNYVSINDCANVTLGIGASPVMAEDRGEVAEIVAQASALVLNIGMLNPPKLEAMLTAGKGAAQKGIPIIFDPVGVGASTMRREAAARIVAELPVTVIRGNLAEIKALLGLRGAPRGVDSPATEEDNREIARRLSEKLACVVAITGKTDVVAAGRRICHIHNGHPLLAGITGTGCMTGSLIAGFCSVANDPFSGAVAGIAVMGIAGELAEQSLAAREGPGTFRIRLLDSIAAMKPETLLPLIKLSESLYEE